MKRRIFIVMICAVMMLSLCGCGMKAEEMPEYPRNVTMLNISADGEFFFRHSEGKMVTIPARNEGRGFLIGALSPNERYIVAQEDDVFYMMDLNTGNQTDISYAENLTVVGLDNSSCVFSVEEGEEVYSLHRYAFKTKKTLDLGSGCVAWANSFFNGSMLLAYEDGTVMAWPQGEYKPIVLDTGGEAALPLGISDDGKMAVWYKNGELFLANGKELEHFAASYDKEYGVQTYFNSKKGIMLVGNGKDNQVALKKRGKPLWHTALKGMRENTLYISTKKGDIKAFCEGNEDSFYFSSVWEDEHVRTLYYLMADGVCQEVMQLGTFLGIQNGVMYYTNREGGFYSARPKGADIPRGSYIDRDIHFMQPSADGSIVCYFKNADEYYLGDLYCAKEGEEGKFVESEVYMPELAVDIYGRSFVYMEDPYGEQSYIAGRAVGALRLGRPGGETYFLNNDCLGPFTSNFTLNRAFLSAYEEESLWYAGYTGFTQNGMMLCDFYFLDSKGESQNLGRQFYIE